MPLVRVIRFTGPGEIDMLSAKVAIAKIRDIKGSLK